MIRYQRGGEVWSIEQVDTRVTIVESDGTERVEDLPSRAIASARVRVLSNAKVRDGWKLAPEVPEASVIPSAPAHVENAREPALEAALLEDPDNAQAWHVYGDWLQQQGDPRGTFIALRAASRDDLLAMDRLRKYEARHKQYLYGGVDVAVAELGWGFLDRVRIISAEGLAALDSPAARFVTKIEVTHGGLDLPRIVEALGRVSTLRELSICTNSALETLAPIELGRLRNLHLHCRITATCVGELARTELPNLVELGISNRQRVSMKALFERQALPKLTRLYLDDPSSTTLDLLANSPLAPTLRHLVLVQLPDDLAQRLAGYLEADRFPALVELEAYVEGLEANVFWRLTAAVATVSQPRNRFVPITE